MHFGQWFRPPRHLLMLFLAIMLVLAATLGWLSWRLLQQDRALENQRTQERLDNAADLIGAALLRKLSEAEDQFTGLLDRSDSELETRISRLVDPAFGTALVAVLRPQGVDVYPRTGVIYYPSLPANKEPPASVFASGEAFEFQEKDYIKAKIGRASCRERVYVLV